MINRHINITRSAHVVAATARRSLKTAKSAYQPRPWQTRALATYQRTQRETTSQLPKLISARISALTGVTIAPASIFVDQEAEIATAAVDGVVFRAHDQQVFLLRSCAECGIEHFESQPLNTRADLGRALSAWQPLCRHCQPEDPANWLES
jgi:hypothetical protein